MESPVKRRKSSASVKLVLIGTMSVAVGTMVGCNSEKERRDVYASKEACLSDWGNEPADCTPTAATSNTRTGGGYFGPGSYFGRSYRHVDGETGPRSSRAISSAIVGRGGVGSSPGSSVSRGGFGSSGRSSSG